MKTLPDFIPIYMDDLNCSVSQPKQFSVPKKTKYKGWMKEHKRKNRFNIHK